MTTAGHLIEIHNISKAFGAVQALNRVELQIQYGEVLGIVGDNAAGKSTLLKILSGVYRPDRGRILIDGHEASFEGPEDARRLGIDMIYQDFALVPQLDVTDNIFLGRERLRRLVGLLVLDRKAMEEHSRRLFQQLGLAVPSVRTKVRELSGGQQQAVAIARATGFSARLILMDEPTANLGATAIEKVRQSIRNLRSQGVSVVVVSHRLEDVFGVGDRVVVLKHGRIVGERRISETDHDEILGMIISGVDRTNSMAPEVGGVQ